MTDQPGDEVDVLSGREAVDLAQSGDEERGEPDEVERGEPDDGGNSLEGGGSTGDGSDSSGDEDSSGNEEDHWGKHNGRLYDRRRWTPPPPNRTAKWWAFFVMSVVHEDKVLCLLCNEVKTWSGSSSYVLKSHIQSRHKTEAQALDAAQELNQGLPKEGGAGGAGAPCPTCGVRQDAIAYSPELVKELNRHLAAYIARHCRPFEMVRDDGFRALIVKATCGRWTLPSTDTLRAEVDLLYKNTKLMVQEEMEHLVPGTATFLFDGWTGLHKKHFMGSGIVYLSKKDFKERFFTLSMCPWTAELSAEGHANMVRAVLKRWDIAEELITYANADNCSTMIACIRDHFPGWFKLPCGPHWLHLTVSECIWGSFHRDGTWAGKGPRAIRDFIVRVKDVVHFYTSSIKVKESWAAHLESMEESAMAFVKDCETRWSGIFCMLRRMSINNQAILQYCAKHPGAKCLESQDVGLLDRLIQILEPFHELSKMLQSEGVTISRVWPSIMDLVDWIMPREHDPDDPYHLELEVIKDLRQALWKQIDERWLNSDSEAGVHANLYKLATALDPRYFRDVHVHEAKGYLRGLVSRAINTRRGLLKEMVAGIKGPDFAGWGDAGKGAAGEGEARGPPKPVQPTPQAPRAFKLGGNRVPTGSIVRDVDADDGMVDLFSAMGNEEVRWLFSHDGIEPHEDPMAWWEFHRTSRPILYCLAKLVLYVPASAAMIERLFSAAGITYTKHRSCLQGDRADKLLVVKSNWKPQLYKRFHWEAEEEERRKAEASRKKSANAKAAHNEKRKARAARLAVSKVAKKLKK